MGEIEILGRAENFLKLRSNLVSVQGDFLCSGQKWMRLLEQNMKLNEA
jgi:hypothetical protein